MYKEEIAHYEQFLLFLQCFQKACFSGVSKGVIVWERVKVFTDNLLTLYQTTVSFDPTKLKTLADNKKIVPEILKFVLARVQNIVGKEENAGYQHFLLFVQFFQKAFSLDL